MGWSPALGRAVPEWVASQFWPVDMGDLDVVLAVSDRVRGSVALTDWRLAVIVAGCIAAVLPSPFRLSGIDSRPM